MPAFGGKADIEGHGAITTKILILMMEPTELPVPALREFLHLIRTPVGPTSYSGRTAELVAFLEGRRTPLVDIGGQIH